MAKGKILIDPESWAALDEWLTEHPGLTIAVWDAAYFEKMEIHFSSSDMIAYAEKKRDSWKCNIKSDGRVKLRIHITKDKTKVNDFAINYGVANLDDDETLESLNEVVRFVSTVLLTVNAYLTYGNAYEDRPVVLLGKNEDGGKSIIFRVFEGKAYAVATTTHRSPSGVFGVRGHFRRYKSGKVIWIDEYMKGLDKE